MMTLLDASNNGIMVTIILGGLTLLVFILLTIGKAIVRSESISILFRRHAFIYRSDIRLHVSLLCNKPHAFSGFQIYAKDGKDRKLVAVLNGYPLGDDLENPFVHKEGETYSISIVPSVKRDIVLTYELVGTIDDLVHYPLVMSIADGNKSYEAEIENFESLSTQELMFHRRKPCKKPLKDSN